MLHCKLHDFLIFRIDDLATVIQFADQVLQKLDRNNFVSVWFISQLLEDLKRDLPVVR